jgi:predicted DNA-binding transcriptional regulator AlpA
MTDQAHRRLRTSLAAPYVGYSESTLEKKRLTGEGPPFIRLGRTIVYDTRDLVAWLASRRATSTSDRTGGEGIGVDIRGDEAPRHLDAGPRALQKAAQDVPASSVNGSRSAGDRRT